MKNCEYCGTEAVLVTGLKIYPHRTDLDDKKFWLCESCDAYVGCHGDTSVPLGRLAKADLRQMKLLAHNIFDARWRSGKMSRSKAYAWLAENLGISKTECHIGMFDVHMCQKVVKICKSKKT